MLNLEDLPISLWVAIGLGIVWAACVVKSRLNYLSLTEIEAKPAGSVPPDCMVVIPARNEEDVIGRAVKSLPHDTVIVVDDASEDKTSEVAQAAGAGVLRAPELGKSAIGKSNACAEGARVLTSKWILFADADAWFEPGFMESAVGAAESGKLDFLSIYLRPAHETFAERVLAPFAEALYFFGMNPSANPVEAFNGQCILVRREAYEFIGGHGTVIKERQEDIKLAALAARHRMKFGVARSYYLGRSRVRTEAFRRNAHRFTEIGSWVGIRILMCAALFALWAPAVIWLALDRLWIAAAVLAIWPMVLLSGWYQGFSGALLAPLGVYGMLPVLWSGFLSAVTGRPVEWKGRVI